LIVVHGRRPAGIRDEQEEQYGVSHARKVGPQREEGLNAI
jgi:hypothetical protein